MIKGKKEEKIFLRTYPNRMAVFLQIFMAESGLPELSEHSESLNSRDNLEEEFHAVYSTEDLP